MGIFDKLFGSKTEQKKSKVVIQQSKIKRTIFDFFEMDIKVLPDESFIKAEIETNTSGETVENYRKTINYKECGIFDTVEVKIIGGKSKNIFLKSFQPDNIKFENLKQLIDDLYLLHGDDSDGKGKFTDKDIQDYKDTEFYVLFGRSWTDYPKHKNPVAIGRDEDEVSMSIWGVENEQLRI